MPEGFQLAQINIARAKYTLDDDEMKGFTDGLEEINALADLAPGFVWRLKDDSGDATSIQAFDDRWLLINLSVWESTEALKDFTYRSAHVQYVRRRKDWFAKLDQAYFAMWWIKTGHIPTIEESQERLQYLNEHGDTSFAFTFRKNFPPSAGE